MRGSVISLSILFKIKFFSWSRITKYISALCAKSTKCSRILQILSTYWTIYFTPRVLPTASPKGRTLFINILNKSCKNALAFFHPARPLSPKRGESMSPPRTKARKQSSLLSIRKTKSLCDLVFLIP